LWKLEQAVGVGAARAAVAAAAGPDAQGWLTITLSLEDMAHAVPQILTVGIDARVVEPAELRDEIWAAAREIAAAYG
jgi:predicted DNA-binding transcriptional regulator YafY